jgi:predicted ATPase
VRADFSIAQGFAEQTLRLAQQTSDSTVFLIAHCMLSLPAQSRGEFITAREHFDKGLSLYDPQQHRFMALLYGDDPGITCLSLRAFALWFLGYPDQALQSAQEGLALARALDLPYNLAFALDIATWIHFYRGDPQAAQTCLAPLSPLVSEQGFQFFSAESAILQGWVMSEQGREAEGLARMRPGVVAYHATGAEMSRPTQLGLLAKTYGKVGQIQEGLATVAEAFAVMNKTGEYCLEAELYRLKGQLTLAQSKVQRLGSSVKKRPKAKVQGSKSKVGVPQSTIHNSQLEAEAEACFLKAIEIARRQQAKSLELRATVSLARLWQQQGNQKEAHRMLSSVYDWFTEGFDTADLQEAKTLLRELAAKGSGTQQR